MITSNDFKTGLTIQNEGSIFQIIEFQHVKPGKGSAFVRSKLRNLRTGSIVEKTWRAGEKVEPAMIDKQPMQYIYADGNMYVFMNTQSYEQIEIPKEQINHEVNFLKEGMDVNVIQFENEILGVDLPEKVTLEVTDTVPGVKGNTVTNASKDAIVETGYKLQVPLFVNEGDYIVINTSTGKYSTKA